MNEFIFKLIYGLLLLMSGVIRGWHVMRCRKLKKVVAEKQLKIKIVVSLAYIGMSIIPLIHIFSNWFTSCNLALPLWARIVGAVGFALTILLYWWTHKVLGKHWSNVLVIKEEHKLITEGPYKYVRHPMYTTFWMWVIFQGLLLANWLVWIVGIGTWSLAYFTRIEHEEQMMLEQFGQEYKDYMKKTGRLLPKFSRISS
jgi:protein-S-isoprenylcysteine O-methyltransferase Ste14